MTQSTLHKTLQLADGDAFYQQLVDALDGMTPDQSQRFMARLVLLLANQVGDAEIVAEAISAASDTPPAT